MEHAFKVFLQNCKTVWDERNLISLHRPIFVAFAIVVFAVATTMTGGAMWLWLSATITSRDNEIRIKDATIQQLQGQSTNHPSSAPSGNIRYPAQGSPVTNLSQRSSSRIVAGKPRDIGMGGEPDVAFGVGKTDQFLNDPDTRAIPDSLRVARQLDYAALLVGRFELAVDQVCRFSLSVRETTPFAYKLISHGILRACERLLRARSGRSRVRTLLNRLNDMLA